MPGDYSWLIAPGDAVQPAYGTITRMTKWQGAIALQPQAWSADYKQNLYSQWVAQMVHCQTNGGANLLGLNQPITLSAEAIDLLTDYFDEQSGGD